MEHFKMFFFFIVILLLLDVGVFVIIFIILYIKNDVHCVQYKIFYLVTFGLKTKSAKLWNLSYNTAEKYI